MSDYRTLDPNTGELLEEFPLATEDEIEAALEAAQATFEDWRSRPLEQRTRVLEKVADALDEGADRLAAMMATEMGKPLEQGRSEVEKCAWVCRHYAEHAADYLAARDAESDGSEAFVRFDPLGPILAIMPWNFPLWQVFRFAAPALAAGNVGLLKHASSTPRCAAAIAELFTEASGLPGLFQNLYLSSDQAEKVIEHDVLRGVTLTGSTGAGRAVAAIAGGALRPTVMELGGSDPFIVFGDADLDDAVEHGITSRCQNSGQSCIAAKRFIVDGEVYDDFVERFVEKMKAQTLGDPKDEGTDIGPLAREDLRETLHEQVEKAKKAGGRVLCGGEVPDGDGFFYPATVIVDLPPDSDIAREEFFGPVATIFRFDDENEAIEIANGTEFGLGSNLWTSDRDRIDRLLSEIDAGSVFVNGYVKSDPRLPFGGTKQSGFGRELSRDGLREWVNVKTVWIG